MVRSQLVPPRNASRLLLGSTLLCLTGACEKLVGIEDTLVTRNGGAAGESGDGHAGTSTAAGSSSAGSSSAGSSSAGSSSAGSSSAGSLSAGSSSAGSSSAGSSSGGSSSGGSSSGGSSSGGSSSGGSSSAGTSAGGSSAGAAAGGAAGTTAQGGSSASGGAANQAGAGGVAGRGGSGGASECPCSAPKPSCENGKCVVRGPELTKITDYYIDSTEVTAGQYKAFLAAKGTDVSGQRAACEWNDTYQPSGANNNDAWPVVNVDFCDAAAFCEWADKKLCGAIGGGSLPLTDSATLAKSQWYLACAGPSEQEFPYGNIPVDDNCNTYPNGEGLAVPKTFPSCEGTYPGVWDLFGNVIEWIDACNGSTGVSDKCAYIGGSFTAPADGCYTYVGDRRDAFGSALGFRCCSK